MGRVTPLGICFTNTLCYSAGHLIPGLPMLPCWQLTYHITSQFSEAVVKQVKEAADRRAIAYALV